MTKKNSTKRTLIASILVLCLCLTSFIGTTFAWFTDSVTSGGNIIKSGKLDVELYYADGKTDPAATSTAWTKVEGDPIYKADQRWEPGYTDAKHIKIANAGTLALKYQLAIVPTGEVSKLADVIDVYYVEGGKQIDERADLSALTPIGTLADLINNGIARGALDEKESFVATLVLKMQESANDDYQELSIGDDFDIRLLATQATAEEDSFDKYYDAGAPWLGEIDTEWYDADPAATEFTINTAEELAGLAEIVNSGKDNFEGDKITLASDLDLNDDLWTPIGTSAAKFNGTFDGAGHTIYNLYVNNSKYAGLFGCTWTPAHIEGLTIDGAYVAGNDYVGAVVGGGYMSQNCIKNCTVKNAEISATPYLLADGVTYDGGAKAGAIGGSIYNANLVDNKAINCTITAYRDLGGIAGMLFADGSMALKATGNEVDNVTVEYFDLEGAAYADNKVNENLGSIVGRLQTNGSTVPVVENNIETNVKYGSVTTWTDNGALYTKNEDTGVCTLRELTADYKEAEFTVPEGVNKIGNYAFVNSTVETVVLSSTVEDLGRGFDSNSSIKKVVLNEGLEVISSRAFRSTMAIEEVVISSTVHTIADNAFQKSAIKTITIPANVKTIGETAFGASLIETVIIEGNTNVEGYAFRGCTKLSTVYLNGNDVKFVKSTLNGRNSTWFCNSESNNPNTSNIVFYVKNEVIKERVLTAMGAERNNTTVICEVDADENGVYTDSATGETYTYASTNDSLKSAISKDADTVYLSAGTYTLPSSSLTEKDTIVCAEGTVFEGNSSLTIGGATIVDATFSNPSGSASNGTINGTFKNCTFEGSNAMRWAYAGKTVVFENCVFNATGVYAIHFDGTTDMDILFKNCKITGWVAIAGGQKSLVFDGCEIYGNGAYGVIRAYGDATIKNCTFDVADVNTADVFQDGIHAVGNTIKVENCTNVNGDMADIINLSGDATVILDGDYYVNSNTTFTAAVAAGATNVMLTDGEYDLNGNQKDGLTVIGLGDNVKLANNTKYASGKTIGAIWKAINLENVTITNTVYTMADGGDATFTNVNFAEGFRQGYGKGVKFTDCTFGSNSEGYALHFQTDSASAGGVITLDGCKFEGGNVHLGGKRAYEFTGCDFAAGTDFQVWSNITLDGCTVNGETVNAENIATFFPKLDLTKVTIK